ncbi:hypothetical protein CcCBS67573_g07176 [Chytriomyces confervae]|uniref:Dynactin subunit 4 n=1 Tax=Chytriomyces confervae TaxID=246404 RepID=A0A507EYK1_9FUNG|nr:hypothetical protein CcCBS67573_g07176 [Chytriomyces confervae]
MDTPADAKHYLSCGVCRWDSLEIGLQFDRPTGLAMQMQKAEDDRKDVQEFANLRSHFEKTTRLAMSTAGPGSNLFRSSTSLSIPPSLLANIPALASLSAFGASKTASFASLDGDPNGTNSVANYVPKFKMDGSVAGILEDDEMDKMKKLTIDDATFLSQRMRQIGDQPRVFSGVRPQRILLRTKRAKRCKDCDTLVCKPEQKAQIPKFTVLMPALDYIPKLTIAQPPPSIPLKEGEVPRCKVNIRFANPLATPIRVLLATVPPEQSHMGMCRVDGISAPAFTLDAYNELSEFEDDKKSTAASGGGGWFGTKGPEIEVGLVEKRNNWAIVAVDVIVENTAVLAQGSPMQFPLLITALLSATRAASTAKNAPAAAKNDEDEGFDLFGSDDEEEVVENAALVEACLKEYQVKKTNNPLLSLWSSLALAMTGIVRGTA